VIAHIAALHTVPAAHDMPHEPQLPSSTVRSRHTPEQFVRPTPQLVVHTPALQIWPAAHAVAQLPQCKRSVDRSRHTPEQFVSPPPQLTTQLEPLHT